ncbi:hypothetical protein Leryth_006734 [Lithospermum erythrorhizon]|nr:hypothetical protein Leryth_006734 [Lithospermum erythrorhizon]
MSQQIVLHGNSPSLGRRQPLLEGQDLSSRGTARAQPCSCGTRVAEVVGGTTAECAAVCCCCPFGLLNLVLLAVYKLPAGLYKKALRKRRRRKLLRNGHGLPTLAQSFNPDEPEMFLRSSSTSMNMVDDVHKDKDVLALEEEMWGKFYGSGFWRSPSQKSDAVYG